MTILNLKKVIIPVASLGTRLLPATKALPKEMLPVLNKPIIQYIVEEAINLYLNEGNELVKYSLKENVYDCGDKLQYLFANIDFALKDPSLKSELNKFLKSRLS